MYEFDIPFNDDKGKLLYTEHVIAYSVNDLPTLELPPLRVNRAANGHYYINIACGFDIESSTVELKRPHYSEPRPTGFMYQWQFCIDTIVIMGRRWEEYLILLDFLHEHYHLSDNRILVIYCHFLEFEFQFSRNFLDITDIFAREERSVMYARFNHGFEYRCSWKLSNMSLSKFIKNTPNARFLKLDGDSYFYGKLRTPDTPLTDYELGYCYCDVRGLCEAINHLLETDTIASLPLTSTGFLRREVRTEVLANKANRAQLLSTRLSPHLYVLCKTAARGGNSHANAYFTEEIHRDMRSRDRKSSYPAEMIVDLYPVTAFQMTAPTLSNVRSLMGDSYQSGYALLLDCTFYRVNLRDPCTIPYISFAKCTNVQSCIKDNGRIVTCKECSMVITDVDYLIITSQYSIKEVEFREVWVSTYGHLNNEFRTNLMDKFLQKTILEIGDPYLYVKFKNKINAYFGMMLTDICSPEILYDPSGCRSTVEQASRSYPWRTGEIDISAMLDRYYDNRKSFLSYQHGIWVTANARYRHQQAILACGEDIVYGDTDSVKFVGSHDKDIDKLNVEWLELCHSNDIPPYVHVRGKDTYLGVWEDDGSYDEFITLGAKKYAYTEKGDEKRAIHITVAGLAKEKGAHWLEQNGGLQSFKIGTTVPKGDCGRTTSYFNDEFNTYYLDIEGSHFVTGSNIGVVDSTYTFGVSDDYYEYFLSAQDCSRVSAELRNLVE